MGSEQRKIKRKVHVEPNKRNAVICRIIRFEAHLRAAKNTQVRKN